MTSVVRDVFRVLGDCVKSFFKNSWEFFLGHVFGAASIILAFIAESEQDRVALIYFLVLVLCVTASCIAFCLTIFVRALREFLRVCFAPFRLVKYTKYTTARVPCFSAMLWIPRDWLKLDKKEFYAKVRAQIRGQI